MRFTRTRLLAAGVLPLVLLAGCGSNSGKDAKASGSKTTSSTASASPLTVAADKVAPISDVKVNNAKPTAPAVSLTKKPFQVNKTTTEVIKPGTGATVADKDIAYVSYVAVNGTSGKTIESTFGKPNAAFNLGDKQTFPGLVTALRGKKVGSELAVAVPPAEGFGGTGAAQLGITAKDTLIFYVKINDHAPLLTEANGSKVAPKAGLPTVTVPPGEGKEAKITVPKGAKAPTTLVSQDLLAGKGQTVIKGQTLLISYTGQIWSTGTIFDSTAKQGGKPASLPMQDGQVIPGFVKGLVGKKVGSRVLLVIPPADGYGKEGSKDQSGKTVIKGTDTLVFVVDILAAM